MRATKVLANQIKHDEILRQCNSKMVLDQISDREVSVLVKFILSDFAQSRLSRLPIGTCTRFDKRTKAASARLDVQFLLSFQEVKHKQELPRTIIAMKKNENVTVAYILLGCKLANSFYDSSDKPYKRIELKQKGYIKQKTNVLCLTISNNLDEITVKLMAVLKVKKDIKARLDWIKLVLHTAQIQHALAQNCSQIMDCEPLTLDATFREDNLYVVTELGQELVMTFSKPLNNSAFKGIIISDLCKALCFLHRLNMLHRDIKLENVIIVQDSVSGPCLKLIDFDFINEPGKGNLYCGTKSLLPTYYFGAVKNRSKHYIPKLVLTEEEQRKLYDSCIKGTTSVDIWCFGIFLFELCVSASIELDTPEGAAYIDSFENSKNLLQQLLYQILCPKKENCYILATEQGLQEDLEKPIAERTYLSMEKIYNLLFKREYKLDEKIIKELQPRMSQLIATRPKVPI